MKINWKIRPSHLTGKIRRLWKLSGPKIKNLAATFDSAKGSAVFTVRGRYTARGWTEWTQGFQAARLYCNSTRRMRRNFWNWAGTDSSLDGAASEPFRGA